MLMRHKHNTKNKLTSVPMSTQQIIASSHANEKCQFITEKKLEGKLIPSNVYQNISIEEPVQSFEVVESQTRSPSRVRLSLLRKLSMIEKPIEVLREEVKATLQDNGIKVSKGEIKTYINEAKDYHLKRLRDGDITFDQFKSIIIREKGNISFKCYDDLKKELCEDSAITNSSPQFATFVKSLFKEERREIPENQYIKNKNLKLLKFMKSSKKCNDTSKVSYSDNSKAKTGTLQSNKNLNVEQRLKYEFKQIKKQLSRNKPLVRNYTPYESNLQNIFDSAFEKLTK